jgi:hypothetical protein
MSDDPSPQDLANMARTAAFLTVDASRYTAADLAMIVSNMAEKTRIEIINADGFSDADVTMITRSAGGQIFFS